MPPLHQEDNQSQSTEGNQNRVSLLVVWAIVFAVDLGADERTDLHNDIVGGCGDGSFLDVKSVFGDPG